MIKDLLGKGSGLFFVGVNIEARFLTDGSFLGKSSITTLLAFVAVTFGVRTLKIKMLIMRVFLVRNSLVLTGFWRGENLTLALLTMFLEMLVLRYSRVPNKRIGSTFF